MDFDDTFDDSMVKSVQKKDADKKDDSQEIEPESEPDAVQNLKISESRLPVSKFLSDVLPKLPEMANGIKLLGVAETNPLIKSEEIYKLRYVRPDKPIGHSEIWEDSTTLRLTVFGKLISDELQLTFCRFESAGYIPGIQDDDAVGTDATKGVLDAHDVGNMTVKPFLHRKTSG